MNDLLIHFRQSNFFQQLASDSLATPFYAYDLMICRERWEILQASLPANFKICYSMKANPHPKIIQTFKSLGSKIDVSSLAELQLALSQGFLGSEISFVGPGKTPSEIEECFKARIDGLVIESLQELQLANQIAEKLAYNAKVLIRVNPSWQLSPGGKELIDKPSQFGVDEGLLLELATDLKKLKHVTVIGLHFYLQSQFLNANTILKNFRNFLCISEKFQSLIGRKLDLINLGGGFGLPYFEGQVDLNMTSLRDGLVDLLKDSEVSKLASANFIVESGRYLAGPCGIFITKVLVRKESQGKIFLICDGGFTQHMAATGVGQLIRYNFPISAPFVESTTPMERVNICGPSCYSMDILAQEVLLPKVAVGDYLCIGQSGAYGMTFSPQKFLSRPQANEIVFPQ